MKTAYEMPTGQFDSIETPFSETIYSGVEPATISVRSKEAVRGEPLSMEDLLDQYKEKDPGVFSVGGTFGIDSEAFGLEVNNVYVSVVKVLDDDNNDNGKFLVVQGMAHFHIAKLFKASAALIGPYDTDILTDPLDLFNKEMDDDEKAEAVRARNAFATLSGDTVSHYELIGDATETNGLYFLFDTAGSLTEKQTVFTATGLMNLSWLEKIGVNCGLKIGVIAAYNTFEDAWEVGLGAKFSVSSDSEWMVIGRLGFKSGKLNTIAVEVNGEVPIGPVVFTQIKFGVTGLAETVQTYSPGLGVAFGPEINFKDLVSPVAKVLGLKVGNFHVVEAGVSGDVSSDFNDVNLSVEGKLLGLVEIKGGWKRVNGNYNEISLSVGTKSSSTFNFCISGSVGWSSEQLTVKGSFDGSFKWDFTALGITWVGVNVGGGISVIYNENNSRKTISVAVNGRAQVKVVFVKIGVDVSKSWFFDLSRTRGELGYECVNTELAAAKRPDGLGERIDTRSGGGAAEEFEGEVIGTYSWTATDFAAEGAMVITVAAQYSLSDVEWVLYSSDGKAYTSNTCNGIVDVKRVSYSQMELSVTNPEAGVWTLDVYGSKKWNGEMLIFAEAGDPIETDLRIVSVDKTSITVEYQAHATGENYLAALYMEKADKPDDEFEGVLLDYLQATDGDERRQVTIDLPEDVQGGEYKFYVMAQSTNYSEIAYSAKTEAVEVVRRTAALSVSDYRVQLHADAPQMATLFCTVENLGSEDANDFLVEVLLGDSEVNTDDDLVVGTTRLSLAAGESRQLQLEVAIPEDYHGELSVMSIRLDNEKLIDEGIFENDNVTMKTLSFLDDEETKSFSWEAVEGAASYKLEYAVEGDWDNDVALSGITDTSVNLDLAPGNYSFRITPYGANGEAIEAAIQEWDDDVCFTDDFNLVFDATQKTASTEEFSLLDGFYDWSALDLGNFTGTLSLYQVDGIREGKDAKRMTVSLSKGKLGNPLRVTYGNNSKQNNMLLENGLYYFSATRSSIRNQEEATLSFSLTGDLFPNLEAERGVVSLPDSVDAEGRYSETLEGWVGAFAEADTWEYLVEDAGELCLTVNNQGERTGTFVVDLYVQNATNGQYTKAKSLTVKPNMNSEGLLDNYLITNNFYVKVHALDNGKGKHNTDYSLNLSFEAFDDAPLEEEEWLLSVEDDIQVDGWVGYGNPSETYLLEVEDDQVGEYSFQLTGDASEATIKLYSITGKLLKSKKLNKQGVATISDFSLYAGEYLVTIDASKSARNTNNTDYSLSITQTKAFETISADNPVEIGGVAKREKLFYALDVQEEGLYDVSELLNAGLTLSFYEAKNTGSLGTIRRKSGQVELPNDDLCYMKVYNSRSDWGTATIELDEENHKFHFNSLLANG